MPGFSQAGKVCINQTDLFYSMNSSGSPACVLCSRDWKRTSLFNFCNGYSWMLNKASHPKAIEVMKVTQFLVSEVNRMNSSLYSECFKQERIVPLCSL